MLNFATIIRYSFVRLMKAYLFEIQIYVASKISFILLQKMYILWLIMHTIIRQTYDIYSLSLTIYKMNCFHWSPLRLYVRHVNQYVTDLCHLIYFYIWHVYFCIPHSHLTKKTDKVFCFFWCLHNFVICIRT